MFFTKNTLFYQVRICTVLSPNLTFFPICCILFFPDLAILNLAILHRQVKSLDRRKLKPDRDSVTKNCNIILQKMANKYGSIFPSVPLRTKSGSETFEATVYSHKFSFESLGQLPAPLHFFLEYPRLQSLWLMPSEGQKTCFFCHFSKKQVDEQV